MFAAAAGLVVAGLAALPFAGSWRAPTTLVATEAGRPSTAPAPTTATTAAPITAPPVATTTPPPDASVEPPPIEVDDIGAGVGAGPDQPAPALPDPPIADPGTDAATAAPVDPGPPDPGATTAPPPSGSVAVADVSAPPPPPAAVVAEPQRVWAVAIGIDDYPGTRHDLLAARRDAIAVVDALLGFGVPADHILELLDDDATVADIVGAADWLAAHAGPDDIAVFFYAGHVRQFGAGTELVVAADGGWIADWFLGQALAPMAARQAWMVIAGCFGGGFDELLAPGRILTGAAPPGVLAYENDVYNRSYLVEYVFERALRQGAAGAPTVQAAVGWAMDRLAEEDPGHQLWNVDQADELISLDGARRGPAPDPASPPDAPTTTAPPRRPCLVPGLLC